ncbi:MAG: alpha-hydroxy acid oxidase [Bacteroidota bacterium]
MDNLPIHPRYPSIALLREQAKRKIPRFAFDYLDGGCNNEVNLARNTKEIRDIQLHPYYLRGTGTVSTHTKLFGEQYAAPFGIAPIGLQSLMWPRATEILAKTAFDHNIPFILSTVATANIEKVAEITEGKAWFQLYHPQEDTLRDQLLDRLEAAGIRTLVLLSDVPTFGYRAKEIKNGLSIPPKITWSNMVQITLHPHWAWQTLLAGQPTFKTLTPYIPKGLSLRHLGLFMNKTFNGRLTEEKVEAIRRRWKGKLILKGVATVEDAKKCIALGLDGIIVSNHGGRQLDAAESSIKALGKIAPRVKDEICVMMDSGIRSGTDVASCLAAGAAFTFLGRSFMYGVAAMGRKGGKQVIAILHKELQQVMQQVGCESTQHLSNFLVKKPSEDYYPVE